MSHIIIQTTNGSVVADGQLGSDVLFVEGNYYFNPELVNDEYIRESTPEDTYTCPIKRSTCIYYNLYDESGTVTNGQVAWNYKKIENTVFKTIENRIGFYATDKNGLVIIKAD